MVVPYASWTGTKSTLAALKACDWRLLLSAEGHHRSEKAVDGFRYALDNGAWTAFQQQRPFNFDKFEAALERYGPEADWVVVPDIVEGGMQSLELSARWIPRVLQCTTIALLAVQDGMTAADVEPYLSKQVGVFVGGSTAWKLENMPMWGAVAERVGCWSHVGRVNSAKRIAMCADAGVWSFDGTSVTRFPSTLPLLNNAVRKARAETYEN